MILRRILHFTATYFKMHYKTKLLSNCWYLNESCYIQEMAHDGAVANSQFYAVRVLFLRQAAKVQGRCGESAG